MKNYALKPHGAAFPNVAAADDRYTRTHGQVFLSGIQALVRLTLVQRWRDIALGVRSAGFISGYRGSPLGGLDEAFGGASKELERNDVRFQPGINEDLAATAVWGTQQVNLVGSGRVDGVYAMWYGKSPGVDRCGDVFKHANHSGTSKHGGVLLVAGDDHGAYSSTLASQSDQTFIACMIPWLYPSNVEEYIQLGLHGWAMSRFSGCLVGFKALADTVESSAPVDADPMCVQTVWPTDMKEPPGGYHARLSSEPLGTQARQQEALLHKNRIQAALEYARVNRLNHVTLDSRAARFGIVASGKSYADTLEALRLLGIDESIADAIGLRLFKVSMPWPLEPHSFKSFALGLEDILVLEEKRPIIEPQIKDLLYSLRDSERPRIHGKSLDAGQGADGGPVPQLPSIGEYSVDLLARVIAFRIKSFHTSARIREQLACLDAMEHQLSALGAIEARTAYYCSGCPHSASTRTPAGSVALAGIGCHVMATAIFPESNLTATHMGAEGATWIGQAPFSDLKHVFANLGDGTYYHSGHLAVRAAVAANVNITYKILYNDAVAMTGGQRVDGPLDVCAIARQVSAEGVRRIAVVTEDLSRYGPNADMPAQVTLHGRDQLDSVQLELREVSGVSVLIYDQTCAAEKRRRRRGGTLPQPSKRLFINEGVCEGCGDCGSASNCTSILPTESDTGRKRQIDQASCNGDFTCADGFCPSFVSVVGGRLRSRSLQDEALTASLVTLPTPSVPNGKGRYNILIAGIGGTGIVTVGAWLGMAAHQEGKATCVLDMTGMSQKNGAVITHVRLADAPFTIASQRIPMGEADLIIGCDMLVSASQSVLRSMRPGRTRAVLNAHQQPTGRFAQAPDWQFPADEVRQRLGSVLGKAATYIDVSKLATLTLGDAIYGNALLLGYCWQSGLIPLEERSLLDAIDRYGVAPELNRRAFALGRLLEAKPDAFKDMIDPPTLVRVKFPMRAASIVQSRAKLLCEYQGRAYSEEFLTFLATVREHTEKLGSRGDDLVRCVANGLFRLMAYKDEYEVARLYTNGSFERRLDEMFEGDFTLRFHLSPPWLGRRAAGKSAKKGEYGSWVWYCFRLLAPLRIVRGTWLDPFGYQAERRLERALIPWYRSTIDRLLSELTSENLSTAIDIASLPDEIRGYGHVKAASLERVKKRLNQLQSRMHALQVPAENVPDSLGGGSLSFATRQDAMLAP